MPRETGGRPPEQEDPVAKYRRFRDQERIGTTEDQRQIAEIQALKYEMISLTLQERTRNNGELINAMNEFLDKLENLADRGISDEPLARGIVSRLTEYFHNITDQMYRDDGMRPPDRTKSKFAVKD